MVKEKQKGKASIHTVDTPTRLPRCGKGGRDLHYEGLAEAAKDVVSRFYVPGVLGDIVIVFVDDDPASLQVAQTGAPALDIRDVERNATALRRLGCDGEKREMGQTITRAFDGYYDAGRPDLAAFGLAAFLLPYPEIG